MSAVAVKISSELAALSKAAAEASDRSLTGQIEHWAKLGRAVETQLSAAASIALKASGGDLSRVADDGLRESIRRAMDAFDALPRQLARQQLGIDQQARFEPNPQKPGTFVRISPDGSLAVGTLEMGRFVSQ
jgi:hypothetical protein